MTIYEKIHAIMGEVRYLNKDDNVSFGQTKYKALSEEKVTEIMREKLVKYKLVVFPIHQESSRNGQISHVDVVYRMVNVENPQEFIDIASCGDGADSQDKGSGKAMTYAFKYMWLRAFALPTGEDPDKVSSEELDAQAAREAVKCECCGEPVVAVKKRDGTMWEPNEIVAYSIRAFQKPMCAKCLKEAQKKA